jgi:enamine deaminase RidA (YjgF/YER057c/UK114 family)
MPTFRTSAKAGNTVYVAGMVGRDVDGSPVTGLAAQTAHALRRVSAVLRDHAASLSDVVRLRIYVTDVTRWASEVLPTLAEAFDDTLPPATVVQVVAFVEPWMEIEIDAEATAP